MSSALLLSAGRDPELMFTRRKLLEKSGYSVVEAATTDQLVDLFTAGDFDLVILCHTIPEKEKRNIAKSVRQCSPSTPILALISKPGDLLSFADASVLSDPGALLSEVPRLIEKVRHRAGDERN